MANAQLKPMTLDQEIIGKLQKAFRVSKDDICKLLDFFNTRLKPALKTHYLSHLVASIEEMINEQEKKAFLSYIEETGKSEKDIKTLTELINEKRIRLFTINLQALPSVKRKAMTYKKKGGVMIYYADYLLDNERRFVIAHELGHIVSSYLIEHDSDNCENYASLFAYIALLDKNDFYKNESPHYVLKTDVELFNEYMNLVHIS